MTCRRCGREVTADEYAVTRKLINRGLPWAYCADCLADHFEVTREDILERIAYFKKMGCSLFGSDN